MIFSLRGRPLMVQPFFAVVECGGVGYGVKLPLDASEFIAAQKGEILLYTRTIIRENAQELYGFLNIAEAELFDFLRELHGIGPGMSLNLISTMGSDGLIRTLLSGDIVSLQKAPKVGKARADKIIFEARLKEKKLQALAERLVSAGGRTAAKMTARDEIKERLYEALQSLGFQQKEIERAEQQISKQFPDAPELTEETLQESIRLYLRCL